MVAKRVGYSTMVLPEDYKCGNCGATGCKLWVEYQGRVSPRFFCAICAAQDQGKSIGDIDADGRHTSAFGLTDQIGWFVPAVPDEGGAGYWFDGLAPQEGVDWWRRLPTLPTGKN